MKSAKRRASGSGPRPKPKRVAKIVRRDEFVRMLDQKIAAGQMTIEEKDQILLERSHFDKHRAQIKKNHPDEVVAFSQGQMFTGNTVHDAVSAARRTHPGKMTYFEEPGMF